MIHDTSGLFLFNCFNDQLSLNCHLFIANNRDQIMLKDKTKVIYSHQLVKS
jgi:hypothetical protein